MTQQSYLRRVPRFGARCMRYDPRLKVVLRIPGRTRGVGEVLPDHRHRLLQRRSPPGPRAGEGRRRLPSPATGGCGATTSTSSWGWTSTARRCCRRPSATGSSRRPGWTGWPRRFEEFWRRLECSNDDWIRTTEPRHHRGASPSCSSGSSSAIPDDLYVGEYEGLYCTGCEEFKQPTPDRQRPLHRASHARAGPDQGAQSLLPPEPLPRRRAGR